jgi:hypothetical protein
LNLGYVSGTSVATSIGLGWVANAGSAVATAAPFSAFAQDVLGTNLFNGLVGYSGPNAVRSSSQGTNTLTAAATWAFTLAGESALIATTAMNPYVVDYDFDGSIILPPNNALVLLATAATAALLSSTLSWIEVPA